MSLSIPHSRDRQETLAVGRIIWRRFWLWNSASLSCLYKANEQTEVVVLSAHALCRRASTSLRDIQPAFWVEDGQQQVVVLLEQEQELLWHQHGLQKLDLNSLQEQFPSAVCRCSKQERLAVQISDSRPPGNQDSNPVLGLSKHSSVLFPTDSSLHAPKWLLSNG